MSLNTMKNLKSRKIDKQVIINANESKYTVLPFFKSSINLSNEKERTRYIKSIENMVRTSSVYRAYIKYLKEDIGLTKCMMFGDLTDEMCNIEMHHGPIFTLYDYVEITLIDFIKHNKEISTFSIAQQVLKDHTDNLVQIVMLSEMAHQAAHVNGKDLKSEFVDIKSAWGDIEGYLLKYKDSLQINHINKIHKYFEIYNKRIKDDKSDIFIAKISNFNEKIKNGENK